MEEKILTLHPEKDKVGVNISKGKYDVVKASILESIRANKEVTFNGLTRDVEHKLGDSFDGSIPWYVTTVKLDLEARGIVERVSNSNPQRLRLASE